MLCCYVCSHDLRAKAVSLESKCLVRSDGPGLEPVNADTRTAANGFRLLQYAKSISVSSSVAPGELDDDSGRKGPSSIGFCVQDIASSACSGASVPSGLLEETPW